MKQYLKNIIKSIINEDVDSAAEYLNHYMQEKSRAVLGLTDVFEKKNTTDFSEKSTTTQLKRNEIDANIYRHIHVPKGQCVVMLVGNADGLESHLDNANKMGIDDLNYLWIIDNQVSVINNLQKKFEEIKEKYNGTPHFVTDDMLQFLRNWSSKNGKLYFVDFDGTQTAGKYYIDVVQAASDADAEYISLVGSVRSRDQYLKTLADEYGIWDVRHVYMRKKDQIATGLKYDHNRKDPEAKLTYAAGHDILLTYLEYTHDAIYARTYSGVGRTSMFAYLFKLH